ncbi:transglutaminase [Burkholderia gladioli]|nr:transglutaminase [Burkholderia gladioli]
MPLASLILSTSCLAVHAAEYRANSTILSNDIVYDVHADGSYTKDVTELDRIDTEQGVREGGESSLGYSTSLQALEIVEAYTLTRDGRRIDVTPDQIREQQSPASARAPMFVDQRLKVVVFPAVEVGAKLMLRYRLTQKTPLFPGQFSALEQFSDGVPRESMQLTVRAPAAMPLQADAVDLPGGRQPAGEAGGEAGVQVWRWSLSKQPARTPELYSTASLDRSPRVAITSFADYAAIGAAYQQRAMPKAAVTPKVQALADSLTEGVSDRRRQAEMALLAAKGIASQPVLVNSGNTYWVPKVALPLGVFDHAITYLPEFDLYVDSTAMLARFGVLPSSELGKRGLVAGTDKQAGSLRTLPLGDPAHDTVRVTRRVAMQADGTLQGSGQIDNEGIFDLNARSVFASLPPGMEAQVAERVLALTGQDGTGTYHYADVRDLGKPFVYGSAFRLPEYALLPGPGAIPVPVGLGSINGIASTFDAAGLETRQTSIAIAARHVVETTIVTLAPGVRVPRLPKPVAIDSPLGSYRASYRHDGSDGAVVTVTRDLLLKPSGPLITPADYPAFRKFALAVKRELRTQLVY